MLRPRLLLIALACLVLTPTGARAAVTLGPEAPNPDPSSSQAINWLSGILLFTANAPAGVSLVAPADGVITSWQLYTDDVGNEAGVQLRTLRPTGGTGYAVTGAGPLEPLAPANPSGAEDHNVHHTFTAGLRIAAGEMVGVSLAHATASFLEPVLPVGGAWKYGCLGCAEAIPTDGSPSTAQLVNGQWLAMNARLEPDVDHDGLGDETQDSCVGACPAPSQPSPPATKPKKKAKKKCRKHVKSKGKGKGTGKGTGKRKRAKACSKPKKHRHGHRSHGKR